DQLDLILKSIAEGVTAQTADGWLIFANDAAAHICGFESAEKMLAMPPGAIGEAFEVYREDGTPFPPNDMPSRRAARGEIATAIVRFRPKRTREERWSIVSSAPVFDAEG